MPSTRTRLTAKMLAGAVVAAGALGLARPAWADTPALSTHETAVALLDRAAAAHGVPPAFLLGLTWQESGWQNNVESSTGAVGMGQLEPSTVDFVGRYLLHRRISAWSPADNADASAAYLAWILARTGHSESMAAAAYYQGLTSLERHGMYTGTRHYVADVMALTARFGG